MSERREQDGGNPGVPFQIPPVKHITYIKASR
jgi:hypothetical protein